MPSPSIRLISLNIESDKHFETLIPFLKKERADVVCLQEIYEDDLDFVKKELGYTSYFFAPMCKKERGVWGIAIYSPETLQLLQKEYYSGLETTLYDFDRSHMPETVHKTLLTVEYTHEGISYVIGNTHFTWTPDGETNDTQRVDMPNLLNALSKNKEIVFCGDFNAQRGKDMWAQLAENYHDNLPPEIDNTLDPLLHRVPGIKRPIDGMFSTPEYTVTNVRVESGISDHCALVGEITKTPRA